MSLVIVVTIPQSFLVDQLNVGSPQDIEYYKECVAFAFSDRWNVSDLEFFVSDVATAHFFDCSSTGPSETIPSYNDFTVALQDAIERYRFTRTGDPGTFLRAGSTALEYMFTPLVTQTPDDTVTAPEEEESEKE